MSCLPKPVLRGHIRKKGLYAVFGAVGFATLNVCLFNFLYVVPKRKREEEFFKNVNTKEFSRQLIEWGYFSTVRPEDLRKES